MEELLVLVAADAHAVETSGLVAGGEDDEAVSGHPGSSLHHSQYVQEKALGREFLPPRPHAALFWAVSPAVLGAQQLAFDAFQARAGALNAEKHFAARLVMKAESEVLEALLAGILVAVFVHLCVFGECEDGFEEALAEVLGDPVPDGPLDFGLALGVEQVVLGGKGVVVLGEEEGRRPPAFEALQAVPLPAPAGLQVEQQDCPLHWVLLGLNARVDLEAAGDQGVHVEVGNYQVELAKGSTT